MRTRHIFALLAGTALGLALQPAAAQVVEGARLGTEEPHTTITLGEPDPHWVYVIDPVFPHLIASKVYVVDGDTQQYLGMFNTGYVPNLVLAHDKSEIFATETYWSRGSRGERTDVVTFYDPRTLAPTGEVTLPNGRFLVVPKKQDADLSSDGRYLYSFNMDPSMAVSVVDVKEKKHIADIDLPGCSLVFPTGPSSFVSLCPDGSFASVSFEASGKATVEEGEPFFDAENDPVFEHPAFHRPSGQAFFISYKGEVYPVSLKDGSATHGESWSLVGEADRAEQWRPGGWQLAGFHAATNRLFVLMHQGGDWTHKHAGAEVWVFDTTKRERIKRLPLEEHAISVAVSQDDQPLLFTLSEAASMSVFDATSYEHKGDRGSLGDSPFLLHVFGE